MQNRVVVAAGAAVVLVSVAGCGSSPKPTSQPPGSLPNTTAQITINGKSAGTTKDVSCTQDGWTHTIAIGDKIRAMSPDAKGGALITASGVLAVVDTAKTVNGVAVAIPPAAQSVQITNVGGFTGGVWESAIGTAQATIIGTTYKITGTAQGENPNDPNKVVTATFEIKANC